MIRRPSRGRRDKIIYAAGTSPSCARRREKIKPRGTPSAGLRSEIRRDTSAPLHIAEHRNAGLPPRLLLGVAKDAACAQRLVLQAVFLCGHHVFVRMVQLVPPTARSKSAAAPARTTVISRYCVHAAIRRRAPPILRRRPPPLVLKISAVLAARGGARKGARRSTHNAALLLRREVVHVFDCHPLREALCMQVQAAYQERKCHDLCYQTPMSKIYFRISEEGNTLFPIFFSYGNSVPRMVRIKFRSKSRHAN